MDSMRSLGGSLPATSPPEQLLGAFKEAALSVTKLYKLANADQSKARAEGYQDALDELLAFLDREDIGLSDGEGWRIRRWATERLDGRAVSPNGMETDDETGDKQDQGTSSENTRSQSTSRLSPQQQAPRAASPVRAVSQPPPVTSSPPSAADPMNVVPPQGVFTFQSSYPYPQVTDIDLGDLELSDNNTRSQNDTPHSAPSITVSRPPRLRHNNHPTRPNARGGGSVLSRGAGSKRKLNISEFFDFSSSRDYRDGGKDGAGGGGKRGRYA